MDDSHSEEYSSPVWRAGLQAYLQACSQHWSFFLGNWWKLMHVYLVKLSPFPLCSDQSSLGPQKEIVPEKYPADGNRNWGMPRCPTWRENEENIGKHRKVLNNFRWLSPSIEPNQLVIDVWSLQLSRSDTKFVVLGLHWPRTWNHEAAQEKTQVWRPHVWRDWEWSMNCARHQVPVCLALVVLACQLWYLGARRVWFFADCIAALVLWCVMEL